MPLAVFNHVVAVVEDAVETFVEVGHVITTIEVVINKNLPITVKAIVTSLKPMKLRDVYPPNLLP
jgi:hypothetical protein